MTELNLKLIMEIILQYTCVSNHYVIHQKLTMLYVNYSKKFSGQHDHGRVEVTVGRQPGSGLRPPWETARELKSWVCHSLRNKVTISLNYCVNLNGIK